LGLFVTEGETNQNATSYFDCEFWFLTQKEEHRSRGAEGKYWDLNGGSDKRLESIAWRGGGS
jgi:hypothetical protein